MAEIGFLAGEEIDMSEQRSYPRHVKTDAGDIEIRLMSPADEAAVLAFGKGLPTHDLLFLPRNISEPKVLSAWVKEIERGAITSLLAVRGGTVVGCGTLVRDPHSWSPMSARSGWWFRSMCAERGWVGRCRRRPSHSRSAPAS